MASDTAATNKPDEEIFPLKLRSYQEEMFERSLEGNTIVVMETGSGKTAVAIYRIKHALETEKCDKLIWFLTGSVALCRQQYDAVRSAIPGAVTKIIVGEDGPDLWGSVQTWEEVLRGVDIIISTFAILHSALGHAYVKISRLALLIFDEAHHVTKKHPSNLIMQEFYWISKQRDGTKSLPSILGLTASPAENGRENKLKTVKANLDAVCKTPRKHRTELRRYVHRPTLERLLYAQSPEAQIPNLVSSVFDFVPLKSVEKLKEIVEKVLRKVQHLVEELGWWAAWTFVEDLVTILERKLTLDASSSFVPLTFDKAVVLRFLRPLAGTLANTHTEQAQKLSTQIHMSIKAKRLIEHLRKLIRLRREEFVGIIFVRQRVVTAMLDKLIALQSELLGEIKCGAFVGESNAASYEKQLCELVVPRTQGDTLRDFRLGKRNLIVATDALDEGIDVAACNTIICFDPPQNLRAFVQKRGRARQKGSTYTIMTPVDSSLMTPEQFEYMEKLISATIRREQDAIRIAIAQEALDENVKYCLQSKITGAYLTADATRAHLEHFCAKLPRTPYTELRPTFTCEEDYDGLIVAEVRLPMSVQSAARISKSQQAWQTERAAIKDASFQAYKALYNNGLLTEHLLPVPSKPTFEEDFKEQQREFSHLKPRVCIWNTVREAQTTKRSLFRTSVLIYNSLSGWQGEPLALWTYIDLSTVETFQLLSDGNQALKVECEPSMSIDVTTEEMSTILAPCTKKLVMAARSHIQIGTEVDFVFYITPDWSLSELKCWLHHQTEDMPASLFSNVEIQGLVVNISHGGSLHIFRGWHVSEDESGTPTLEIECSMFPRRRNFLKTKSRYKTSSPKEGIESENSDDTKYIDPKNCLVRTISIQYSWTMRFMPSILHHIEMILTAERLQKEVLPHVTFRQISEIVQSLTCPSTGLQDDYERLEFLGDSLLKFHISRQVFCGYPQWHEEYLTRQRNTLVSNISLAKAAVATDVDKFIFQEAFDGKNWTIPTFESILKRTGVERHLPMKNLADVVESLIGAAFLGGGMESAMRCMSTILPGVSKQEARFDEIIALTSQLDGFDTGPNKLIRHAESMIGYSFRYKRILIEALTHPSCARDAFTEPYQRLEFLGDSVLDRLVVMHIFTIKPALTQGQMTRLKAALVNGDFLAFLCFSSGQTYDGIAYTESSENRQERHIFKQRQSLWMMMRSNAEVVNDAGQQGFDRFENLRQSIEDSLRTGKSYPWEGLCLLRSPKFISDIIESILGAIFVDSNGKLEPCSAFLEKIGLMKYFHRFVLDHVDVIHPKEKLSRLLRGRTMEFSWDKDAANTDSWSLSLIVDHETIAYVTDCHSKNEAIIKATNAACRYYQGNSN